MSRYLTLAILCLFAAACSRITPTPTSRPPASPAKQPPPPAPALKPLAVAGLSPDAIDAYMARAPLVRVSMERVLKALPRLREPNYSALYIGGRKMGRSHDQWKVRTQGGRTYLVAVETFHMEMRRGEDIKKMHWESERVYQGWGDGALISAVKAETTEREIKRTVLKRTAPGIYSFVRSHALLSALGSATETRTTLRGVHERLIHSGLAVQTLLVERAQAGPGIWKVEKLDMDSGEASHDVVTIYGTAQRRMGEISVKGYNGSVISEKPHMGMTAFFGPRGTLLHGRVGIIEIRAVSREEAMKAGGLVDIQARSWFPAVVSTVTPTTARLEITLQGPFPRGLKFFNSARYQVRFGKKGTFTLTLTRDALTGAREKKPPAALKRYLKAMPGMEVGDPLLAALAKKAVAGATTRRERVEKLVAFVYRYLQKSMNYDLSSALMIARARIGDCTEHTLLFTALARTLGIPARQVGGVGIVSSASGPIFGYHAWPQVWLGRWFDVDPTWGQFPADVSHILMGAESDLRWVNAIGQLKVLSFKVTQ